jgi:hypothetical protein
MTFKRYLAFSLSVLIPAIVLIVIARLNSASAEPQVASETTPTFIVETATSSPTSTSVQTPAVSKPIVSAVSSHPAPVSTPSPSASPLHSNSSWYYVFVSPDDYHKIPGSKISFSGMNFYPNETVSITYNGTKIGTVHATSQGEFTSQSFVVPYVEGKIQYTFTGNVSAISFPVNITVDTAKPWMTLSSYYAGAGTQVTVNGHGFGSNEFVHVWFAGIDQGEVQASAGGDVVFSLIIPVTSEGQKVVQIRGTITGHTATQTFSQAF